MEKGINQRQKRQFWLGMSISVICLLFIFFFIDPVEVWEALRIARYEYLLLGAGGVLIFMIIRTIRWRFMLNNEISFSQLFHIQSIGYMFTMLLPFRLGDVARAILVGNVPPITISRGLSTMVVERLLDMLFIVTLLPFTLAEVDGLLDWMRTGARASGIVALIGIIVLIIGANQRPFVQQITTALFSRISFLETTVWVNQIDQLLAGLNSLTRLKDAFVLLILSILVWLPIVFAYYYGLLAVNLIPTWPMAGFVVCAAALSIAIPSSPGQVGVFHLGVTAALAFLGQPDIEAATFAIAYHALNLIMMVLLGLIGLAATGATFATVMQSIQQFRQKDEKTI